MAWLFVFPSNVNAGGNGVIINEIMTGQTGAVKNEFIELYNTTNNPVILDGFKLTKKTKSGAESNLVSAVKFIGTIPAHGYFLISPPEYKDTIKADLAYSGSTFYIADDNTILLYDKNGILLDKVGYGQATDFETQAAPNPGNDKSIERKNFTDTDNNFNDFTVQNSPVPQNSSSSGSPSSPPEPKIYPKDIRVNEILPNPSETPEKNFEFVELYNFGDSEIDLTNWKIKDKTSEYILSGVIKPDDFAVFYDTVSLNNDGDEIGLYNPNSELVSVISYSENAKENYSYGFHGAEWKWSKFPTPNEENVFRKDYPRGVYINEILPSPKESGVDEFIELYNSSDGNIDLSDWELRDSSKTGCYIFPKNTSIESLGFLTVYKKDYKFALNDSGDETVYLFDPNADEASKVSYSDAGEDVSYNFDGDNWRWSRFLTPGEENQFNNLPESKTKNDKNIYVGVWADFSANAKDLDKDNLKYTWDFGDGHKSYKKGTRHKYENAGEYTVTLKIFDRSEDKIEEFNINVKEFPRPKVKIVGISANPKGNDSQLEYITVENNSKKKVNLKDWSVATGSKNLYNHPITKDLMIAPGKIAKITRQISKFILNNKKSKIELRYPNEEVADKVKYNKKGGVENDEVYEKTGNGWDWVAPEQTEIPVPVTQTMQASAMENKELVPQETNTEVIENSAEQTPTNPLENNKEDSSSASLERSSPDQNQSMVLGTSTEKENRPTIETAKKHWYVKVLESVNLAINKIISWFF